MENEQAVGQAFLAGMMMVLFGGCLVYVAIKAFVCWLLSGSLKRIPAEHRKQTPGLVWLMMIPVFDLFWNFMVFPKISESFDSYFKAKGQPAPSTANLSMILCIVWAGSFVIGFIPFLNLLSAPAGLASLILLIIVLVKFNDLKNRIPQLPA